MELSLGLCDDLGEWVVEWWWWVGVSAERGDVYGYD